MATFCRERGAAEWVLALGPSGGARNLLRRPVFGLPAEQRYDQMVCIRLRLERFRFNLLRDRSAAWVHLRSNSGGCNRPWSNLCIERDRACCPPSAARSGRKDHRATPPYRSHSTNLGSVGGARKDIRSVRGTFGRIGERSSSPWRRPPARLVVARHRTRGRELRRCRQ